MTEYLGPLQGIIIGLCLIIFRYKVSNFLQRALEKFPKYKSGVKSLNMRFDVHPSYLMILGIIFILVAIAGFFEIINN
jgi:hypothetical protein